MIDAVNNYYFIINVCVDFSLYWKLTVLCMRDRMVFQEESVIIREDVPFAIYIDVTKSYLCGTVTEIM